MKEYQQYLEWLYGDACARLAALQDMAHTPEIESFIVAVSADKQRLEEEYERTFAVRPPPPPPPRPPWW